MADLASLDATRAEPQVIRRLPLRRVALTILLTAAFGGASFGLAIAGGHLKLGHAKPSLVRKSPAPLALAGLAPGDSAQRLVTLRNRNARSIRGIRFEIAERKGRKGERVVRAPRGKTTPDGYQWVRSCRWVKRKGKRVRRCVTRLALAPSRLLTDPNGLRVVLESCARPWTRLPGDAPTYACRTRTTVLLRATKLPVKRVLKGLPRIRPKGVLYLRMTIGLPADAGNQLQGRSALLIPQLFVVRTGR